MSAFQMKNILKLGSILRLFVQTDLEHTLGESAALGAAGVVLWGDLKFAKSEVCGQIHCVVFTPCTVGVKSSPLLSDLPATVPHP